MSNYNYLDAISTITSIAGTAAAYIQANQLHKRDLHNTNSLHQEACILQKQQFVSDMVSELQQHFISLESDLINASRESERDLVDQRNQHLNTLIVANTLMFGCSGSVIVQAFEFSDESEDSFNLQCLFVISASLSMISLLVSILITMVVLRKIGTFMKQKAKSQLMEIEISKKKTDDILKYLKNKDENLYKQILSGKNSLADKDVGDAFKEIIQKGVEYDHYGLKKPENENRSSLLRELRVPERAQRIGNFEAGTLAGLFEESEKKEWSLLQRRRLIMSPDGYTESALVGGDYLCLRNDTNDPKLVKYNHKQMLGRDPTDWWDARIKKKISKQNQYLVEFSRRMDFGVYWKRYCKWPAHFAENTFYVGIICTMLALVCFIVDVFKNQYNNQAAAYTYTAIMFAGIVAIFAYVIIYYDGVEKNRAVSDFFIGKQSSCYVDIYDIFDASRSNASAGSNRLPVTEDTRNEFIGECNKYCKVEAFVFDTERPGLHAGYVSCYLKLKSEVSPAKMASFLNGYATVWDRVWSACFNAEDGSFWNRLWSAALQYRNVGSNNRIVSRLRCIGEPSCYLFLSDMIDFAGPTENANWAAELAANVKEQCRKYAKGLDDAHLECVVDNASVGGYVYLKFHNTPRAIEYATQAALGLSGNGISVAFIDFDSYDKYQSLAQAHPVTPSPTSS